MASSIRRQRVLVVAWDGVGDSERLAARTPYLDALGEAGFLTAVRVHERNATISGPVWSTVATGVYSDAHGVRDNDFTGNRYREHPDFITRLVRVRPEATTFAAGQWAPLFTGVDGGPVFPVGAYWPPAGDPESADLATMRVSDEATTGRVAVELLTRDHTILFAYLVLPDMVAHDQGVTAEYRAAIETCDGQLGVLLAAIEARPTRSEEEWTIIVLTDHGHRSGGGHGGDSEAERQAWIGAAGPGIDAVSGRHVDHADVAAHVLAAVGVQLAEGEMEGVRFGARVQPLTAS